MSKYQQSTPVASFNPSGSEYDYQTAIDAGEGTNEEGHWASLDPRTGMVLKGRNHKTWDLMIEEETELGNSVIKADDGRYYSIKNNRYTSSVPLLDNSEETTQDNFAKRAKTDYDFAIENNVEFGFGDAIRREWGTASGLLHKIPIVGGVIAFDENLDLIASAERIADPGIYDFMVMAETFEERLPFEEPSRDPHKFIEDLKRKDREDVAAYIKYVTAEKTIMAKITSGASQLPTWFLEFALTGGLASLGDDFARKAGEKILGNYAKTITGKIAIRATSVSLGGVTRSIGLGHRTIEGMSQRQLDVIVGLREEEGWAMSALISWGDVAIEAASEAAGEEFTSGAAYLLGKTKFGSKVATGLQKAWIAVTGGKKGEFLRKMSSKGGYSNIIAEIGEERLGTVLRAITDVDDFGAGKDASMIERIKSGIIQDYENIGVEIGVLSVPFIGQTVVGGVVNFGRPEEVFTEEFDQTQPVPFEGVAEAANIAGDTAVDKGTVETQPTTEVVDPFEGVAEEANLAGDTIQPETQPAAPAEAAPEPPVAVKDANTDKEVDSAVNTLVTGKGDAQSMSARQADLQSDREALGLDGVASPERKGWQKSLDDANKQNIPDNALRIATEINDTPRPLNDTETAGLVIKGARLKNEHKSTMDKLGKTEDVAETSSLSAQLVRIEAEFENLSMALYKSGTEKGRALAAQKLTINKDFDLLSLINRAKARKGRPLTVKETRKVEQLSKDLELISKKNELLQKKVDELIAKKALKTGSVNRYSGVPRAEIDLELDSLVARTRQLLDEGCFN